ncbi:MAG: hypothetical protein ACXU86_04520, partial [Archangium sp.]
KARAPSIYFWAFLVSGCFPLAVEMVLARSSLWAGGWNRDFSAVLGFVAAVATTISSFQSFVVICALAMARKRLGGDQASARRASMRLARASLVLGALVVLGIGLFFWGPDTLPFRAPVWLGQELPLEGTVWKVRDADYFNILGPGGESFAMSVQGGDVRTRLLLDGIVVTDGSLLVSAHPEVLAAITPAPSRPVSGEPPPELPPRMPYHYELVQESIQQGAPEQVTGRRWTLVSLPLHRLPPSAGGNVQWQAQLESTLPPDWKKEGAGVLVHPVLLDLPGMEKGRCLGVFGSSGTMLGFKDALVIRNREDSGIVPPPNSQAELFLEAFRVEPEPGGHWSLVMTVSPPSRDAEPRQCLPVGGLSGVMDVRRSEPEATGATAWLLVAVKMY